MVHKGMFWDFYCDFFGYMDLFFVSVFVGTGRDWKKLGGESEARGQADKLCPSLHVSTCPSVREQG